MHTIHSITTPDVPWRIAVYALEPAPAQRLRLPAHLDTRRVSAPLLRGLGLGSVVALLLASLAAATGTTSRSESCRARLEKIARATARFVEARGEYPYVASDPTGAAALALLVREGYLDGPEDLVCPHRPGRAIGYAGFACPYRRGDVPDTTIILWDREPHADGTRMVASVYEHEVEQVDAAVFEGLLRDGMADAKTGAGGLACRLRLRDLARAVDAGRFDPTREPATCPCDGTPYVGWLARESGTLGPGPVVWERQADRNGFRYVAVKRADGSIEVEAITDPSAAPGEPGPAPAALALPPSRA